MSRMVLSSAVAAAQKTLSRQHRRRFMRGFSLRAGGLIVEEWGVATQGETASNSGLAPRARTPGSKTHPGLYSGRPDGLQESLSPEGDCNLAPGESSNPGWP